MSNIDLVYHHGGIQNLALTSSLNTQTYIGSPGNILYGYNSRYKYYMEDGGGGITGGVELSSYLSIDLGHEYNISHISYQLVIDCDTFNSTYGEYRIHSYFVDATQGYSDNTLENTGGWVSKTYDGSNYFFGKTLSSRTRYIRFNIGARAYGRSGGYAKLGYGKVSVYGEGFEKSNIKIVTSSGVKELAKETYSNTYPLRYVDKNGKIQSFSLVPTTSPDASPLRIMTKDGIKAVVKY